MTTTSSQTSRSTSRTGVRVVRIAAALTLLVALVFQIGEKVANNDLVPQEYFSYFTIQSSMIAIVVLSVGGLMALHRPPGAIMHVWIPILIVLDWLISPGRPTLRWTALRIVVVYPLVWLAFTMVRGAATAWFPYPFLEPATGWLSVGTYVVGIAALIVGLASLGVAWGRWVRRADDTNALTTQ